MKLVREDQNIEGEHNSRPQDKAVEPKRELLNYSARNPVILKVNKIEFNCLLLSTFLKNKTVYVKKNIKQ